MLAAVFEVADRTPKRFFVVAIAVSCPCTKKNLARLRSNFKKPQIADQARGVQDEAVVALGSMSDAGNDSCATMQSIIHTTSAELEIILSMDRFAQSSQHVRDDRLCRD